jgi:GT2 family glycosyltransferase
MQTRAPAEIIVVDDGSTDSTAAIVARLAADDCRIRLLRQANSGQIIARNVAIAASAGALIAPIDADDIWHPRYLERVGAALEADADAGFAYALYRVIDEDDGVLHDGLDFDCDGWTFVRHLFVNFVGNGSGALFRRCVLDEVGRYPTEALAWSGAEDYFLQLRIAGSHRVARVPEYLVGYRRSPSSYSARSPLAAHRARLAAVAMAADQKGQRHDDIMRWIDADGRRVAAALFAKRGEVIDALAIALPALFLDPAATVADIASRARNASMRRLSGGRGQATMSFLDCCPTRRLGPGVDWIRRRRLTKLYGQEWGQGMDQPAEPARTSLNGKTRKISRHSID